MKKMFVALVALATFTPAAEAASHFVKVSPTQVANRQQLRVYGTVTSCPTKDQVIITSQAFRGATKHTFAHVPALLLKQNNQHTFSARVKIRMALLPGEYTITGRCGGGTFGHTKVFVIPGIY